MTHPKYKIYDQDKNTWLDTWLIDQDNKVHHHKPYGRMQDPMLFEVKNPLIFPYVGEFNGKPVYEGDCFYWVAKGRICELCKDLLGDYKPLRFRVQELEYVKFEYDYYVGHIMDIQHKTEQQIKEASNEQ